MIGYWITVLNSQTLYTLISNNTMIDEVQDLLRFKLPKGFRGRNAIVVQIWWLVQALLFSTSPQFLYGWRRFLLRLFGAKIGKRVLVRPSVKVTFPWKLVIGDNSWIGDGVALYNLDYIIIGHNTVISQKSYLCTGSHDIKSTDFAILRKPINIGDRVWIASDVFVSMGCTFGDYAIVGARSSVFKDVAPNSINIGSPCEKIGLRLE